MAVLFAGYFYDIESLTNVFTLVNSKFSEQTSNDVTIDVCYLVDDDDHFHLKSQLDAIGITKLQKMMRDMILLQNPNLKHFNVHFNFLDFADTAAKEHIAKDFGVTTSDDVCADITSSDTDLFNNKYRLSCDTDNNLTDYPEYYLFGYNSDNYDTTMIALFFTEVMHKYPKDANGKVNVDLSDTVTAKAMRKYNDALFTSEYIKNMPSYLYKAPFTAGTNRTANKIRRNMIRTGRNLDVARFNEKQQHVALKKILGMLGFQIFESDNLKDKTEIETVEQFLKLIAYNVSDTVNLRKLYLHDAYKAQFDLKRSLLYEYKDVVYESFKKTVPNSTTPYKPNISCTTVRKNRLTPGSSSAKFSAGILCPYDSLTDLPAVSFNYPDPKAAKVLNITPSNILEDSKKFFYGLFPPDKHPDICAQFDAVYDMYKSVEGKNYNDSKNQWDQNIYGDTDSLKNLPSTNTLLPYFDANGKPTSCFVIFSTGGIHGAEYNTPLFESAMLDYQEKLLAYNIAQAKLDFVKTHFNDDPKAARNAKDDNGKKLTKILYTDGTELKLSDYAKYTKKEDSYSWITITEPKPISWTKTSEKTAGPNTKLDPVFTFTSADKAIHEDFTSYYPKLLMAMAAFYNKHLGEDRYSKIFDNKTLYGEYMKDPNRPKDERDYWKTARAGTKLILNSASGAGDANFDNSIKMNNCIISMRIIGQLFSWRIGQAQVVAGARVPSTNTDGLYTADLDETTNNTVLAQIAANIGVDIEPEPMYLISKDSNNRIEYTFKSGAPRLAADGDLDWSDLDDINSSGGDLGCSGGPDPTKSLAHPAIIDWVLTKYLIAAASGLIPTVGLDKPFDRNYAMKLLHNPIPEIMPRKPEDNPLAELLKYYQNMIAASSSTITYPFAYTDEQLIDDSNQIGTYFDYQQKKDAGKVQPLQKYNRIFIMKDGTPNCVHIQKAALRAITPAMKKTRKEEAKKAATTGGTIPDYNNPLARGILIDNGVKADEIEVRKADYDTAVVKLVGYEPSWSLRIDNRDLYELSQEEIVDIVDNLDLDHYVTMIENKFTSNWLNKKSLNKK